MNALSIPSLLGFLRDKPGFLARAHQRQGDQAFLALGRRTWLLNDPTDLQHVLIEQAGRYDKTPKLTTPRGQELSGSGLHTSSGARHLTLRRMVQPLFHRKFVEDRLRHAVPLAERWAGARTGGEAVELFGSMMALTQQVLFAALLGMDWVDRGGALGRAATVRRRYIDHFFTSDLPLPEYWPLPVVWQYRQARVTFLGVLDEEITARRQSGHRGPDWLSMLMKAEGPGGIRLTDAEIRDEARTLISTGYETVAALLTWAAHLLSHHPSVQEELHAECERHGEEWSVALASSPSLMGRVLDETMRLYPPTWITVRQALQEDRLPNGTVIRRGDILYLCPYTMHRHPRLWPDPDVFDPSRFTAQASRERPRFAFYPFGGGLRQCLGEPYARVEAAMILSAILRRFRLVPIRPLEMPLRAAIVLEPRGGLPVRLVPREAPQGEERVPQL